MTHLDNLIADSLAQSSDTVVHQLASKIVRLRGAITEALRPFYEGGHIWAKPLEEAIWKPAENLFHKNCRSCICWNGDMCELISHICENGEQWRPSAEFVAAHPEVAVLADFAEEMRASASRFSVALDAVLADLAARDAEIAVDAGRLRDAAMRVWGEDAHGCDTPDRLADAILGLRAQIADLKRGGVAAPEPSIDDDEAILKSLPAGYEFDDGPIPLIHAAVAWVRERSRTIPADRVLREGEARIGMNELQMLRCFAGRRMSEREYDHLEAVRDAHEDALRAQATQELAP